MGQPTPPSVLTGGSSSSSGSSGSSGTGDVESVDATISTASGTSSDPTTGSTSGSTTHGSGTTDAIGGTTAASTGEVIGTGTGASSSEGGMPASCDDIFGAAPDYVLCMADATSCTFTVSTGGSSCDTVCASFGEACLGALDNPGLGGDRCLVQGPYDCASTSKAYTICICTR